MIEVTSHSAADTHEIGRRLAGLLKPGDVVLLSGRLGCGKTLFTAGVGDGLGVDEPIVSPTFVIVRQYEGFLPLIHADVYRLSSTGEFDDLEIERLAADGVLVVEWGQAIEQCVAPDHLRVDIAVNGDDTRTLRFQARGAWLRRGLEGLSA